MQAFGSRAIEGAKTGWRLHRERDTRFARIHRDPLRYRLRGGIGGGNAQRQRTSFGWQSRNGWPR